VRGRHVDHGAPALRRRTLIRRMIMLELACLASIPVFLYFTRLAFFPFDVFVTLALLAFFIWDLTLAYNDAWDFDDEGVVADEFHEWSQVRRVDLGPSPMTFFWTGKAVILGVEGPRPTFAYSLLRLHPLTPPHDSPVWDHKHIILGLQRASPERIDLLANRIRLNVPSAVVDPRVLALARPRHEIPRGDGPEAFGA